MIAFILVTYYVLAVYYWRNSGAVFSCKKYFDPQIVKEIQKQKYMDDPLYCKTDQDCVMQSGCLCNCATPINIYNQTDVICEHDVEEVNCGACMPRVAKCIENKCIGAPRREWQTTDEKLEPFTVGYYTCEVPQKRGQIYRISFCDQDDCWHTLYDPSLDILDHGKGELKTDTHSCQRIETEVFENAFPKIYITSPKPRGGVSPGPPLTITGKARGIFENTLVVEMTDQDTGEILWSNFTTANGPGEIWDYKDFSFEVPDITDSFVDLFIFWESPKDGSRQDVVQIL